MKKKLFEATKISMNSLNFYLLLDMQILKFWCPSIFSNLISNILFWSFSFLQKRTVNLSVHFNKEGKLNWVKHLRDTYLTISFWSIKKYSLTSFYGSQVSSLISFVSKDIYFRWHIWIEIALFIFTYLCNCWNLDIHFIYFWIIWIM